MLCLLDIICDTRSTPRIASRLVISPIVRSDAQIMLLLTEKYKDTAREQENLPSYDLWFVQGGLAKGDNQVNTVLD